MPNLASAPDAFPILARSIPIPAEILDQAFAQAYRMYQDGRLDEADILCRGLIAADHTYWYPYSLHAAVLLKRGQLGEAVEALDAGLRYEPNQPKLIEQREAALAGIARMEAEAKKRASTRSPQTLPIVVPKANDGARVMEVRS